MIELLVTIAVAVILATIAVPNFQSLIAQRRLDADYFQVLAGLKYARSEALKRRDSVTAVMTPDSDGAGWHLEVKLDDGTGLGDIDCTDPSDANCLMVRDYNDSRTALTITTMGTNVTFNAIGRAGGSMAVVINHGGNTREVCVELSGNVVGRGCA